MLTVLIYVVAFLTFGAELFNNYDGKNENRRHLHSHRNQHPAPGRRDQGEVGGAFCSILEARGP